MTTTAEPAAAHFDVVVLGAGSGGYTAAVRASQLGLSVAIVEERFWGGVCLNIGCIPTKSLMRNAEVAHLVKDKAATFGITSDAPISVDYEAAFLRSRKVVDGRVRGVNFLMRKNNITQFNGHGHFSNTHTLRITPSPSSKDDATPRTITFANCIIDVGATTNLLPGTTRSPRVVTYEEQIMARSLPASAVIIGAGAIGAEFAYLMRTFGVDVTLVEYADRILPLEDEEVSAEVSRRFTRSGIAIRTATAVSAIQDNGPEAKSVTVTMAGRGEPPESAPEEQVTAEIALQAVGFTPRVTGYGLENTGVRLTERGAIDVDGHCRTSEPHIFAIGDVTAKLMLAHVADTMGLIAAESIAGVETMPLDFRMVPRVTFCQPQVASFGWTEAEARENGAQVVVTRFPFTANGKAPGLDETVGFVKLITDETYGELLGAHLVGSDVAELLPELTLAQMWDLTAHEVARNVHAHPTLGEAVKEAIHGAAGHMINM